METVSTLPLKGYEGNYVVDSVGQITSVERWVVRHWRGKEVKQFVPMKLRKASDHMTGYSTVRLCKDGVIKTHRIHRLVAQTFLENPENKPFVNHKDGNKRNNAVNNLEWATAEENTSHAITVGLFPPQPRSTLNGRFINK